MGEFGAVSVVSGHVAGRTMTMPLQVQYIYDSPTSDGAFAIATLLAMLALVTLVLKNLIEWITARQRNSETADDGELT